MVRSVRKLPESLVAKVAALNEETFVLSGMKRYPSESSALSSLRALSVDSIDAVLEITPDPSLGPWARRNVEGLSIPLKNLPMEQKSYSVETPNFGDWSKGSHTMTWNREVYQRLRRPAHEWSIRIEVIQRTESSVDVAFTLGHVFPCDGYDAATVWFGANVLLESTGVLDARGSSTPASELLQQLAVDWEILPPGELDAVVTKASEGRDVSDADRKVIEERMEFLVSLKPTALITGSSGFTRYVGALFGDDLVVFENARYGNAAYVMFENWQDLSQRSRVELLESDEDFVRIVHKRGWKRELGAVVRRELRKRST